ncbi:MAG: SPFH domain-containing protein [Planctomycetota bacterium]|nr:SPFH domain-containing protein [Planctomycetota bacterium]
MRADLQAYRSAASAAFKGLAFQIVLAVATVTYSIFSKDYAAFSGMLFMLAGIVAWLVLGIVYDQHRRERVEAMENEALAAGGGAGTSVFEGRDEFRPAAARLAGLYKFLFPFAALLIAAMLIGLGIWRVTQALEMLRTRMVMPTQPGWALGLGVTFAALGFVAARYAAGLAKQPVWQNLRAGASFAVGSSLIWLAIAVAHLVDYVGTDALVRWMPAIIPGFIILIGVEIVLHIVLGAYRPRRAGEMPRAAFESRLLGFAAAPDRLAQSISDAINYQLGFDVTGGWGYRLLSRWIAPLLVVGVVVIWLMSAVVVVQPHQRATVLRFGAPVRMNIEPGWHFKWMWPIETVYIPEYYTRDDKGRLTLQDRTATGLRRLELGTMPPATTEPILWTNDHIGEEVWQYVRMTQGRSQGGLADVAAISIELPMQYTISDVFVYDQLGPPENRDELLRAVARREVTRFFQTLHLDEVLGGDRAVLSGRLRTRVQAAFDALNPGPDGKPLGAGVQIDFLGITGVHPPKETAMAFEAPVQTTQRREARLAAAETDAIEALTGVAGDVELARRIVREIEVLDRLRAGRRTGDQEANAVKIVEQEIAVQRLLEDAGGAAAAALAEAGADRWHRHMGARAEAARYRGQVALYEAQPDLFRVTRFFEALGDATRDIRLYVVSDSVRDLNGVIDLKDVNMGVDVFDTKEDGQ